MADIFLVIPAAAQNPGITGAPPTDPFFASLTDAAVIPLERFELGVENPVVLASSTTGASAGKPRFGDLTVVKPVDQTSPQLFHAMASAGRFPAVQVYVREPSTRSAGKPSLAYEFQQVLITAITWAAATGDEPAERLTLTYGVLVVAFRATKADGSEGSLTTRAWNGMTHTAKVADTLRL